MNGRIIGIKEYPFLKHIYKNRSYISNKDKNVFRYESKRDKKREKETATNDK